MCIYLSDSDNSENDSDSSKNDSDDSENDSNDSISSGCHTDSNPENSIEYSDLSMTETVTIGEQPTSTETLRHNPFFLDLLNITKELLIDEQPTSTGHQETDRQTDILNITQTDNTTRSVKHVQTLTHEKMMIVDHDELEILEKVHILHSYLSGRAVNN